MQFWMKTVLILGAVLALAGCREEEQGRSLTFEPGIYRGEKPAALTDEQVRALQERSRTMR